jgi:hypothetical protein
MDITIASLCGAGLALVPIPPTNGKPTKAPKASGWNRLRTPENPNGYSTNAADFVNMDNYNFGLYHGTSNTLALDLDDLELSRSLFDDLTDLDLSVRLESLERVEIKSPKFNRGKLLFKLPEGFTAIGIRQLKKDKEVIFELRCGNCQDVIHGQHPEGGNYKFIGNPEAIPLAPPVLIDMLQHWNDWKACFESALGIQQIAPRIAPQHPQQTDHIHGFRDPIKEFNQAFTVADVLLRNEYKPRGKDRFIRPGSESKAPGAVIMRNCSDGIEHIYSHGGDVLNDGFAHDPFDCMRILQHGGDRDKALNWNPEITKHNQRLYMHEQSKISQSEQPQDNKKAFSLARFSLKGCSSEMRKKMLDVKFVLRNLAILGQATVIFAKPNTGKTLLVLWLLIQAIKSKNIEGDDVYYINADDNYKGLVEKLELAEQYGFHMLAPGHNGFESKQFLAYMRAMIIDKAASGKIIILDTLKKFADLMDKKTSTDFMKVGREFVANGGTLILLAHTNKNRNAEGKVVFAGTSDIVDDVDCAYTLDEVGNAKEKKSVLFENFKMRGDVALEAGFTYSIAGGQNYFDRLNSVESLDEQQAAQVKKAHIIAEQLSKDDTIIKAIIDVLEQCDMLKTDLVCNVHQASGFSKARINTVLTRYEGKDFAQGHRWYLVPGDKNSKVYSALKFGHIKSTSASDYRAAKYG